MLTTLPHSRAGDDFDTESYFEDHGDEEYYIPSSPDPDPSTQEQEELDVYTSYLPAMWVPLCSYTSYINCCY